MPKYSVLATACVVLLGAFVTRSVVAQAKLYRGSIGDSYIEMRLNFTGNKVTGTYSYDRIRQDIKLDGQFDNQGKLQLFELGAKNKPTAKIICKRGLDDLLDAECMWSRLDGSREVFVSLNEQHVAFTDGMTVVPKMISDRRLGINVSYPQLANGNKQLSAGSQRFNRAALASVQKAIKEFEAEPGGVYNINYIVLFAADDLISVEFAEDSYVRGTAHPTEQYWAITYDLKENREISLEDLFKPGAAFKNAIARAAVKYINARADALEKSAAENAGRKPEPREEPMYSEEELSEPAAWGITPKGLMIYFDFPHVAAFFDRTFVPYNAIKEHLKPDGPVARFQ